MLQDFGTQQGIEASRRGGDVGGVADIIDAAITAMAQLIILQAGEILGPVVAVREQGTVGARPGTDVEYARPRRQRCSLRGHPSVAEHQVEREKRTAFEQRFHCAENSESRGNGAACGTRRSNTNRPQP